jgi:acetylglutamate kinase
MSIPENSKIQAEILVQALPYIRRWHGRTVVIKYGGAAMIDDSLAASVMQDVVLMHYVGVRPILVHGGGPEISEAMKRLGKQPKFVQGLRVTDAETMEIVEMVLTGKTNKRLVSGIHRQGGRAVGLSGKDGQLLVAKKVEGEVDLGFVGEIEQVNPEILNSLIEAGYIPVISTVGIGTESESLNLNADHAAGALAAALGAVKLILLTDVPGVLSDPDKPESLISEMSRQQVEQMIQSGRAAGGMIPKLQACLTALEGGVERTHILDGRVLHAILIEVFTDSGIGTMVK